MAKTVTGSGISLGSELLDERVLAFLHNVKEIKFWVLKVGPRCNGMGSFSFSQAECDIRVIRGKDVDRKDHDDASMSVVLEEDTPVHMLFQNLFRTGYELIEKLQDGSSRFDELPDHMQLSLKILNNFFREKDKHDTSLSKIHSGGLTETDLAIIVAEHLLVKLSPGQSFVIDSSSKKKGNCKCGCNKEAVFGNTGIGHEWVWHGFLDIILSSHEGLQLQDFPGTACYLKMNTSPRKRKLEDDDDDDDNDDEDDDCDDEDDDCDDDDTDGHGGDRVSASGTKEGFDVSAEDSPGRKTITDLKEDVENQSVAQSIVFSLLQKQRHKGYSNYLIPNILISNSDFRIIMYDAEHDVLIRSIDCPIFQDQHSEHISSTSVIFLWMVLHYRIFCSGLGIESLLVNMNGIRSGFRKHVSHCWDLYSNCLRSCVQGFPHVKKSDIPSEKYASCSIDLHK